MCLCVTEEQAWFGGLMELKGAFLYSVLSKHCLMSVSWRHIYIKDSMNVSHHSGIQQLLLMTNSSLPVPVYVTHTEKHTGSIDEAETPPKIISDSNLRGKLMTCLTYTTYCCGKTPKGIILRVGIQLPLVVTS